MATDPAAIHVDVLARDDKGRTVLVVEIKRQNAVDDPCAREQVKRYVRRLGATFAMLVDDERILVAPTTDAGVAWERAIALSTPAIVAHYFPGKDPATMEGFFLKSLIEAWLRDFAFGWHGTAPPGLPEMTALGVAAILRGADVATEQVA